MFHHQNVENMAMKKVVLFLMLLATISVNAQTTKPTSTVKSTKYEQKVDSLLSQIDTLIMINNQLLEHIDIDLSLKNRYKLGSTFLKRVLYSTNKSILSSSLRYFPS